MAALRVATSTTNVTEGAYVHLVVLCSPRGRSRPAKVKSEKATTTRALTWPYHISLIALWFHPGSRARNGGRRLFPYMRLTRWPHHGPGNCIWLARPSLFPSLIGISMPNSFFVVYALSQNEYRTSYSRAVFSADQAASKSAHGSILHFSISSVSLAQFSVLGPLSV